MTTGPELPTPARPAAAAPPSGQSAGIHFERELKSPAPYVSRYLATKDRFRQKLDVRVLKPGAADALFAEERALLFQCSHPSLPPITRYGSLEELPFYAVPFPAGERHVFLSQLKEPEVSRTREIAVGLLSVLACLQQNKTYLGSLHPSLITWDPDRGHPMLPFPLAMRGYPPFGGLKTVPPPLLARADTPARRDLLCWAVLCYRLFTGTKDVFPPDGGPPNPLRSLVYAVPAELAKAIDGCLLWDNPGELPPDAKSLLGRLGSEALSPVTSPVGTPALMPATVQASPIVPGKGYLVGGALALLLCAVLAGALQWLAASPRAAGSSSLSATRPDEATHSRLASTTVAAGEVERFMKELRGLSARGELPRELDDPVWFQRLVTLAKADPEAARRQLNRRLGSLRKAPKN